MPVGRMAETLEWLASQSVESPQFGHRFRNRWRPTGLGETGIGAWSKICEFGEGLHRLRAVGRHVDPAAQLFQEADGDLLG